MGKLSRTISVLLVWGGVTFFPIGYSFGALVERQATPQQKHSALQLKIRERTEYYEIRGNCVEELQCELREKGCCWNDGKTYDSMTSWEFLWDHARTHAPGPCPLDAFQVTVNIVFRYPKWIHDGNAPQELVQKWDAYLQGLIAHESVHRDMAVETAQELVRAIEALPQAQDCAKLDRKVRKLYRQYLQKLQREAESYDERTKHGGAQGAVLVD